ncbi:MAG: hypothetical protein ACE5F2_02710 [Candidatus Paceibacteria bacterium]
MQEIKVPSDTIKFILSHLGTGKRFSTDRSQIHTAFYKISQEKLFSSLFKEFVFDTSRMYPYSETVEFAFDRLQKSDLLILIGLEKYEVTEHLSKADSSELFTEKEIKLLKKAAKRFFCILNKSSLSNRKGGRKWKNCLQLRTIINL